jgi:Kae1-associated kinase Bud32
MKQISQGAEAIISLANSSELPLDVRVGGKTQSNSGDGGGDLFVIKKRISKNYRIPELDKKIIKQRTKSETKILTKASKIIPVPKPEEQKTENEIIMPFIEGDKLSLSLDNYPLKKQEQVMLQIGKTIGKMHKENLIHSDLTTSNMIYVKNAKNNYVGVGGRGATRAKKDGGIVYIIDFGLGFQNGKYEDKGVDIHLLKQALEAKHFKHWEILFKQFKKGYESINKQEAEKVFNKLNSIEKRGRYRH